jgi:hypothetical protein
MLCQEFKGKVLLLEYYEQVTSFKVLKDYKEMGKRIRYMSVQPIENPSFDAQRLDVDGFFDLTDSSKVVILAGGDAKDISLPFQYSVLKLDRLINDSTIELKLNNKQFVSKPGEIVMDSIVSVIIEGERIIKRTIEYTMTNYGLIDKKNIFDYKDREAEMHNELDENLNEEDTK